MSEKNNTVKNSIRRSTMKKIRKAMMYGRMTIGIVKSFVELQIFYRKYKRGSIQ